MRAFAFAAALALVMIAMTPAISAPDEPDAPYGGGIFRERKPPLKIRIAPLPRPRPAELPLRLEPYRPDDGDPLKATSVQLGPLRARLGGTSKAAHVARYRIENIDILGGSVSGTLDTRGARVFLRWPPGKDDD